MLMGIYGRSWGLWNCILFESYVVRNIYFGAIIILLQLNLQNLGTHVLIKVEGQGVLLYNHH